MKFFYNFGSESRWIKYEAEFIARSLEYSRDEIATLSTLVALCGETRVYDTEIFNTERKTVFS